jgi:hypothetical protein
MQKCMYCKVEINDDRPLTVCNKCGVKVWGEKMFRAIVENMETARDNGDLCHCNNTCGLPAKENLSVERFTFSL